MRRNMLFAINYLVSWVNLSEPSSHQNTYLMTNKPIISVNYVFKFKATFIEQIMQKKKLPAFACQYTIHFPIQFWPWEGYTTVCSGESCFCCCARYTPFLLQYRHAGDRRDITHNLMSVGTFQSSLIFLEFVVLMSIKKLDGVFQTPSHLSERVLYLHNFKAVLGDWNWNPSLMM